jgi:alkylation response protein AidB-like acyl-CoA dehydrogenase
MSESAELEEYRRTARAWLEKHLARRDTLAPPLRGQEHMTIESIAEQRAIQRTLFDAGYTGISFPVEYGGQGLSEAHERVFAEEALHYAMPDFGPAGGSARSMLMLASPTFLARHIPKMLSGDEIWVQFLSEPGAGSDLAGITTRAVRDGDEWILNGSKIWSSGAYYADYGMCLARTNWDVPKHRGLTWFGVKIDSPGVTVRPIREINGDAVFCQEFFDDVRVSNDEVIGEVNGGWNITQTVLVYERGGVGTPPTVPKRDRLPQDLVDLARRAGRGDDPYVRQQIVRAYVNDFVRGELNKRVAQLISGGVKSPAGVASYAKLAWGSFTPIRARIAMEVGGASAILWEEGDADGEAPAINFLNGRMVSIGGGTNEMQRNAISEQVLGLPKEPRYDLDRPFRELLQNPNNWESATPKSRL